MMIAKRLENILGGKGGLGEAEMTQRFQKLRDVRLLPVSRGRNAEDLTRDQIVSGILSIVSEQPGYAGITAMVLRGLLPVGTAARGFANAASFGVALRAAFEDPEVLAKIVEIRISDSEVFTNSHGRAAIFFRDGNEERVTYYVRAEGVSQFQPGKENDFDPRATISPILREIIILPWLLTQIMREVREKEEYQAAISRAFTPKGQ